MIRMTYLLLAAAALTVSCQKETFTSKWKPISFTATEVTGDIRINCAQATISGSSQRWADYTVSGSSVSPKETGTELRWGNALHHFYAVSPANEITGNTVVITIPNIQDAGTPLRFMAAAAEAARRPEPVDLAFQPLSTTLEFTVSVADAQAVVTGFRLATAGGNALAGGFTAALSAHAAPSVTIDPSTTSPEITIPLDLTVHGGETLVLTVAALPQDLTNLTAYFTVNGEEHALPLVDQAGNPLAISAFQNVTITADGILDAEGLFTVSIEGQDVDNYDLSI